MFRHAAGSPLPNESTPSPSAEVTRLIEANVSYAHALAAEVVRKLPPDLERKDIQGWAELGLVEAANAFDSTRGVQFKTFAYYRIRGAIYDGLRKMGWYPKSQYQQMRFEMAANEYMKDASGEPPAAGTADAQLQDLKETTGNLMTCYMLSLDEMQEEPVDQKQESAEEVVIQAEQKRNIRWLLNKLPEINRTVLEGFYFGGLTLDQIGAKLGLSRSWVCRLHAKSLAMLRKQLADSSLGSASHPPATFPGAIR
jgi:RNA polymerase sigma factor for flagellar operon FliA